MGIIKTYSEFINESVWNDIRRRGIGKQIRKEDELGDPGRIRYKTTVKVWDALKENGLDTYFDKPIYEEVLNHSGDDGIATSCLGPNPDDPDDTGGEFDRYYEQKIGVIYPKQKIEYNYYHIDGLGADIDGILINPGIKFPAHYSISDGKNDISIKFYNEEGDLCVMAYCISDDWWWWEHTINHSGEIKEDSFDSNFADLISTITVAVNPNTQYKREWFKI